MKNCEFCKEKYNYIKFNYDCLKKRICVFKKYDHLLVKYYYEFFNIKASEETAELITKEVEKSYYYLKKDIENKLYQFPKTPLEFINLIKFLNKEIFKNTGIGFFGNFRDREIFFDTGNHCREGSNPQNIEAELITLFNDHFLNTFSEQWESESRFLRLCAIFLESFFRIHPFPDGNGRTGRLFLILMGIHSQKFYFERFEIHKKEENNYINALRKAHKLYNHEYHFKRGKAYDDLIKWLKARLTNLSNFNGIEEEPE
jgi:fido (protein-threonine AMPylation protein)